MTRERAQKGHTHDPWPCCGKESGYARGREKNTICPNCQKLIKLGKATLDRQTTARQEVYLWSRQPNWWPRYYGPYDFPDHVMRDRLGDAMYAVATLVSENAEQSPWTKNLEHLLSCGERGSRYHYEGKKTVSIDPALRNALDELDNAIRAALEGVFSEGQTQGRSIMLQLASGKLSMDDYNKQSLKE